MEGIRNFEGAGVCFMHICGSGVCDAQFEIHLTRMGSYTL